VVGGAIWGVIAAVSGYIFGLAAIVLGLVVAAAVRSGAGRITWGAIGLAIVLTFFAVFLGDVIGLTIAVNLAGYSVTILDVIAAYPEIVALEPGVTALAYFFGLLGAAAGAVRLYRDMKGVTRPRPRMDVPVPAPAGGLAETQGITVETLARSTTMVRARLHVPGSPPHAVEASYDTTFGTAKVLLDGQLVKKTRVWGMQKTVDVPLPVTPARRVSFRFYGVVSPRIDISLDGTLVATI